MFRDRPLVCLRWAAAPVGLALEVDPAAAQDCTKIRFTRFSTEDARQVLAGRHTVFAGDSVMAYAYMSLAHFLHSGDDLKVWDANSRGHETPLAEMKWGMISSGRWKSGLIKWMEYFNATSADFDGAELCDCWRERCHPQCHTANENRYFRFTHQGVQGRLTMLPFFDEAFPLRWHDVDLDAWSFRCTRGLTPFSNHSLAHLGLPRLCDTTEMNELSDREMAVRLRKVLAAFEPDLMLLGLINNWMSPAYHKKDKVTRGYVVRHARSGNVTVTSDTARSDLCRFARAFAQDMPTSAHARLLWTQLTSHLWYLQRGKQVPELGAKYKLPHACDGLPLGHAQLDILPIMMARLMESTLNKSQIFVDNGMHYEGWVYHEILQLWLNAVVDMDLAKATLVKQ